MDVLPLVVHGNHPQNNTDEEQQHCNGVASSVHEQPVTKQSELITAERFMAWRYCFGFHEMGRKLPGGMSPESWAAEQH